MAKQGGQLATLKRVCIVGCGGTGKSTLARALGARLQLPVYHMDAMFWKPGWVMTSGEEERARIAEFTSEERWISDGNWGATMDLRFPRAEAIIWLDLPTHQALWGILRRFAHYRGRTRPDMGEGCPEKIDWEFVQWVLQFRERDRLKLIERIERWGTHARLIHIRHRREIAALLDELD